MEIVSLGWKEEDISHSHCLRYDYPHLTTSQRISKNKLALVSIAVKHQLGLRRSHIVLYTDAKQESPIDSAWSQGNSMIL